MAYPNPRKSRRRLAVLSKTDLKSVRDAISQAICALQNEFVHLGGRPDLNQDDLEAIELMEFAAGELGTADALLKARTARQDKATASSPRRR